MSVEDVIFGDLAMMASLESGLSCQGVNQTGGRSDHACAESLWARLKVECLFRTTYSTHEAARAAVFRYIQVFYNRIRHHSALGYLSPDAFEAQYADAA